MVGQPAEGSGRTKKPRSRGRPRFSDSRGALQLGDLAALEGYPRRVQAIALTKFLATLGEKSPGIAFPQGIEEEAQREAAAILRREDPRGFTDLGSIGGCALFAECVLDLMHGRSDRGFDVSLKSAERHIRRLEARDRSRQEDLFRAFQTQSPESGRNSRPGT